VGVTVEREALRIIVVMGVSGAGKTVVGRALTKALGAGWRFIDADDYHSEANKEKMHRGIGLTDADRAPWLAAMREALSEALARGEHVVLACSALKQAYRDAIRPDGADASTERFVYLDVPVNVLRERLERREHHFAPPELLGSQLTTLEEPHDALRVDGAKPIDAIVRAIRDAFGI
jgi:gluconokinase